MRGPESGWYQRSISKQGVPVFWWERLEDVPKRFSAVLAHEFFDALPIHYFQRAQPSGKWAEVTSRDLDSTRPIGAC